MLRVMAEVSCAPVPPKTGIPSSTHPGGHRPIATGTDSLLQERRCCTALAWRSPREREKRDMSVEPGEDHCLRSLPLGQRDYPELTRVTPC